MSYDATAALRHAAPLGGSVRRPIALNKRDGAVELG